MIPKAKKLNGSQVIDLLRKGHIVRRAVWAKDYYVRICNELGFDENGNAIFDDRKDSIYTHGTDGFFAHLGSGNQKYEKPGYYKDGYGDKKKLTREGEGINCFFQSDWEDYGFISSDDFAALEQSLKEKLRKRDR